MSSARPTTGFQRFTYNLLFKRTSNYVLFIVAGAAAFEFGLSSAMDKVWDSYNKGLQFKDLEPIYREKGWLKEGDDDE